MKQDPQDPVLIEADELLIEIAGAEAEAARIQANYDRIIENAKNHYADRLKRAKDRMAVHVKALQKHAKRHKETLFADTDRVDLEHGALTYSKGKHVVRARGVTVGTLKELGYLKGIKVVESVDWDEIGTWPDEKLTAIGTERKLKEAIGYELKE